ncbi:MAG TPA: FHA domain-containing protein, partial [Anaerolineales bacterium]|nr:FHA domain-containing protein [Anaerolineales bacterium]
MNEKQSVLQLLMPKAALQAMTPEARASVPQTLLEQNWIRIGHFPFRVGRESRTREIDGKLVRIEREKFGDHKPNNDLYLVDACHPLHISREHFVIEKTSSDYMLIDRCSVCGVTVGETRIGGRETGGRIKLNDGD